MPDDVLKLVAKTGGMVMVNFYSGFITPEGARAMKDMFPRYREFKKKYPQEAEFQEAIDNLSRAYRLQVRPYQIQLQGHGYLLTLKPRFNSVREKLFGGVREARLSQAAVDVLSLSFSTDNTRIATGAADKQTRLWDLATSKELQFFAQDDTVDAVVHEKFHRDSKNDMTLTITMDDPKLYTRQFDLGVEHFRWIPNQQLDEFTCIPSQVQQYLKELGDPAGFDVNAPPQFPANRPQ